MLSREEMERLRPAPEPHTNPPSPPSMPHKEGEEGELRTPSKLRRGSESRRNKESARWLLSYILPLQ